MQTISSLDLITRTIAPDDQVGDLADLARAHAPRAVAVMQDGRIVGLLECRGLSRFAPHVRVRELMEKDVPTFDGQAPVRRVAQEFLSYDLEAAVVLDGERFLGVVTMPMLLREVGRSWDPLTGLGWSDRLREWGIAKLRESEEVTVLFLDLDNFGAYNKNYGHIVGDYVLQVVSSLLKDFCDQDLDMLVRYGGDEFAIGTIREREAAAVMVERIRKEMTEVRVAPAAETVTFTIGFAGGRRTKERDHIHYASTMDNLINLASKECMALKALKSVAKQKDQ